MSADDERRQFFRITDRIPIEFRRIDGEEYRKLEDSIRFTSTQVVDKLNELYFIDTRNDARDDTDQLHTYMQLINRKLDMIIEMLGRSAEGDRYSAVHTEVSISGAGIRFYSDVLAENDLVELKIVIPVFPYPKITCLCEVVRVEAMPGEGADNRVALKYMVINEKDQDILINYVFMKERQFLRNKKETAS